MSKLFVALLCFAILCTVTALPFVGGLPMPEMSGSAATVAPIPPAVVDFVNAKLSGKIDPLTGGITPMAFPKSGMPPAVADFIKNIIGNSKASI